MVEGYTYDFHVKAAAHIKKRIKEVPSVAVVLGTGCAPFADIITDSVTILYKDIPGFPVSTNEDHAGNMIEGYVGGKYIICMNGRSHFYEGYSMEDLNIPVHVLHVLGVGTLVLTAAHCGMRLLGLALITNMATGMTSDKVDGTEVNENAANVASEFSALLEDIVSSI